MLLDFYNPPFPPKIVCVFPDPVMPYAKTVALYPSRIPANDGNTARLKVWTFEEVSPKTPSN